jgi:hypothetical protein
MLKMIIYAMPIIIFLVTILFLNPACAGVYIKLDVGSEHIKGDISDSEVDVRVFDGVELRSIQVKGKSFIEAQNVTDGYYGVVFFTKDGFYPKAEIFKVSENPVRINVTPLNKLGDKDIGVITGVVYKTITGGKLRRHRGIVRFYGNEVIEIIKGVIAHSVKADGNGLFMAVLPEGEYTLKIGGREMDSVVVEAGRTSIKNIQKGMVMID